MSEEFIYNPKLKGSGIIECIPQKGDCPYKCKDCFFQSGRSYLEPHTKNLPHIPSKELAKGRVVRMNDGNDSNNQRALVENVAQQYDDYFFNTSIPKDLEKYSGPVVLTVNFSTLTDIGFYKLKEIPKNLMFVRIRTNVWNINKVVFPAVDYYTKRNVPVVLTFMGYYNQEIPKGYGSEYKYKKRTTNSYLVLKEENIKFIMNLFEHNEYVYSCGYKMGYKCSRCGNCLREFYNAKERSNKRL